MAHPDVPAEQAHVDHAYQRLEAMRESAAGMLQDAFGERGGTFQAVTERDIRVRTSLSRLDQLQIGRESLVFGRIDRLAPDGGARPAPEAGNAARPAPEAGNAARPAPEAGNAAVESFHLGRLAISDADQEPLVVDWRAPVAEPFYRATGAHPMGLQRRRHFLTEGQKVLDLEDELFGEGGSDGSLGRGLSGSQVLMAALERSRSGRMRDIVATVQQEQDEIIRAPLGGILVVQGGPGTGKTAVALHRAAYLLYTHRFPLERQGVLVVGPNPTFLRYIEHVLPSLGESGVDLSTVTGLFGETPVRGVEDSETVRLKGDPRMAAFMARAVGDRQRPLRRTVEIGYGRSVLRITPRMSAQVVSRVKRRPGPHNARRRSLETLLWRELLEQVGRPDSADGAAPAGVEADGEPALTATELGRQLRRQPEVVEALDRMWPILTPQAFLHDLFGAPPLVELAGHDLLSREERHRLLRGRGPSLGAVAWTEADIALLDEAQALLGPPRRRAAPPGEELEGLRAYGHVVVDEAQDLSPMKLRMLARRSLSGSMTIVGDIAQATGTWAPASWAQVLEHLPGRRGSRLVELTINYRTPTEIMEVAGRILDRAAPGMRPPEAVRSTGVAPRVVGAERGAGPFPSAALPALTAEAVQGELARLDAAGAGSGTLAVIAPPTLVDAVGDGLLAAHLRFGRVGEDALDDQISLLPIDSAKGLEFDSVVVVEPARIVREAAQGLRALYVAVTRSTRQLMIVHAEGLPEVLAGVTESSA